MKTKTVLVFADPGHAWAKVNKKELINLGIHEKISGCSYQRNGFAFLEEDCDLSLYVETLKQLGIGIKFKESHTNKQSRIRNYDGYNPN